MTDGLSDEAALEWLIEEVATYEPSNGGATTETRELRAGRQLGRRHLLKLLAAVGRDCLQGTNTLGEKVSRLVSIVLPEAGIAPVKAPSAPEGDLVRSPVSAPFHDGNSQQLAAELEALKAAMTAMRYDKDKHHAELEALKAVNKGLESKIRLPLSRNASQDLEGGPAAPWMPEEGSYSLRSRRPRLRRNSCRRWRTQLVLPIGKLSSPMNFGSTGLKSKK